MAGEARAIVMEFNELCPELIDRWIGEGKLPNFAAMRGESDVFTTVADVEDPGLLEPWIQWYSVHTGLSYDQHRVFHLTDGAKASHPDLYRVLMDAGLPVGAFSSMNVAAFDRPGSFFVGDPWTEKGDASPAELNVFNAFVSAQVREHTNAAAKTGLADYARFVSFLLRHGLSAATAASLAAQLIEERLVDRRLSYRRVAALDRLQFEVFQALYRRMRPRFATLFLNSTAHLQHSYWRHHDPEPFSVKPGTEEMRLYGDAMEFGYRAMDRLVGRFMRLADRSGATLILMTALSQQPFLRAEDRGGQHFHRLHDGAAYLRGIGLAPVSVAPTMTHQYMVHFVDTEAREAAKRRLEAVTLDGKPLFGFAPVEADANALYFGAQAQGAVPGDAIVHDAAIGEDWRFDRHLYRIDAIKSGRHHPDGALWFRNGAGRVHAGKVSILDFFPTMEGFFGVAAPEGTMKRRGTSLLPVMAGAALAA